MENKKEALWFDQFSKISLYLIGITVLITIALYVDAMNKETGDAAYLATAIHYVYNGFKVVFILLFIGIVPRFVFNIIEKHREK